MSKKTPTNLSESEIEDEMLFDPSTAVDAGDGIEMEEAAKEVKLVSIRRVENQAKIDNYLDDVRSELDIAKRGKKLLQGNLISFPDTKKTADGYVALSTDINRITAFEALFGEGEDRPHIDTFSGRFVDWSRNVVDDRYSMVPLLQSMQNMGLRQQSLDQIRRSFKDWGMQKSQNDLIISFNKKIPTWDGIERSEMFLIKFFACHDTLLNREFGRYFWLSLYNRITNPGCLAPIVLSLFGAQDAGKSYFSKSICRILQQNPEASSTQLDMGANQVDFLRSITGNSVIANIGEMTGFNRADLNKIKTFITATSDDMHYKFEGNFQQQRQWISIMDGNKYEGVQRDDTGNRRLYPVFVGQLPDKDGQPHWRLDFKADFTNFEEDVWQLMAESKAWLDSNGQRAYIELVNETSKKVSEFSRSEMSGGRGIISDFLLDDSLIPALSDLHAINGEIINKAKNKGVWITGVNLRARITVLTKGRGEIKDNHLKIRMGVLGFESVTVANVRGYLMRNVFTQEDYRAKLRLVDDDDCDVAAPIKFTPQEDSGRF